MKFLSDFTFKENFTFCKTLFFRVVLSSQQNKRRCRDFHFPLPPQTHCLPSYQHPSPE